MTLDSSSTMDVALIIPTHHRANLSPDVCVGHIIQSPVEPAGFRGGKS